MHGSYLFWVAAGSYICAALAYIYYFLSELPVMDVVWMALLLAVAVVVKWALDHVRHWRLRINTARLERLNVRDCSHQ